MGTMSSFLCHTGYATEVAQSFLASMYQPTKKSLSLYQPPGVATTKLLCRCA